MCQAEEQYSLPQADQQEFAVALTRAHYGIQDDDRNYSLTHYPDGNSLIEQESPRRCGYAYSEPAAGPIMICSMVASAGVVKACKMA